MAKDKKILIVGAGLGGLAAAIRLARAGRTVEMWEKNEEAGGKLKEIRQEGFRWDMGPSLLTMPHVLRDVVEQAGARLEDHVTLQRLETTCRYFWSDGTVVDENEAFWRQPDVARFLEYARGIYELSGEAYLHYPPEELWRAFTWRNLGKLRHFPKIATFQTLAQKVDGFFTDPHLRQLFQRFATYNGSSPYRTPATFNIIPYVESHFGGWYVRGGMVQIGRTLETLARGLGVVMHYGAEAVSYQQGEITARDGRRAKPDVLICNGDVLQAQHTWLAETVTPAEQARLRRPDLACSGYILFLGVKRRYAALEHHNIFFSGNYPEEFRDIFERKVWPQDPTIYVAISAHHDPDHAPAGQDNFFVLVNAPARPGARRDETVARAYRDRVVACLERSGLENLAQNIVTERIFTPENFAMRDLAWGGSLYGWASHSIRTSLRRPPLQSTRVPHLYFVGGTTHPGGGIPLVLLSGKMVAEKILRKK